MPRIGYSEDFSGGEGDRYPRLKLAKDERKRIVCVESPWMEWTHRLEAPKIVGGVANKVMRTRKDKTQYEDYEMEFISNVICLGDPGTLQQSGSDPANCPACESAARGTGVEGAKRRYSMTVVEYAIRQSADFALMDPPSASLVIWAFTSRMYDRLLGIQRQWTNLREHDLLLGPCEDAGFQRYNVEVAPVAAWMSSGAFANWVGQLYSAPGNAPTEDQLRAACARKVALPFMAADVQKAEQAYLMAKSAGTGAAPQFAGAPPQQSLAQGFGDLIQPGQQAMQQAPQQFQYPNGQPQPAAAQAAPQWPAPPHPLEQQAAAQSQQGFPAPGVAGGFAQVPQQAMSQQAPPQGQNPFAQQGTAQGAPQAAQNPFAQQVPPQAQGAPPQQAQNPFAGVQPQQGPPQQQPQAQNPFAQQAPGGGMGEFHPQTSMNPSLEAQFAAQQQSQQAPAPQQGFPPQAPQGAQPAPAVQQPPAAGQPSFEELFNQGA